MTALELVTGWPVDTVSAAVVQRRGVVDTHGPIDHPFRLASIAKVVTAWAVLIAVEERTVSLDDPAGPPGSTLRHLLSHASGLPFEGSEPITAPGERRIYSNSGIEAAAAHVAVRSGLPFGDYLDEAVLEPLGMSSTHLRGSPAHAIWSTTADMARFAHELLMPRLVASTTADEAATAQFPHLAGIVPGIGRFDPCPWGLGVEIRGAKQPHWTGRRNSPDTFGHFGGAGTFLWVDRRRDLALVALTDRPFDEWAATALAVWPDLSDAVIDEHGGGAP